MLSAIRYPIFASYKLDGIRGLVGLNRQLLSRSLKPIANKQLQEIMAPVVEYCHDRGLVLDGEFYSPSLTFQEITHYVMTQNLGDESLPPDLKFYVFDCVNPNKLEENFTYRQAIAYTKCNKFPAMLQFVSQRELHSPIEVVNLFEEALQNGCEGLILKDMKGRYKCGRGTLKEGLIFKVKPWETFDAIIADVIQSTEVDEKAEKKINELGRSVTSKKKGDRVLIEKASAFQVFYNNNEVKVTLAMTDEEKIEVWQNRDKYIGKWIEYKGMMVGSKDVPRHPVMVRFRADKD